MLNRNEDTKTKILDGKPFAGDSESTGSGLNS